MKLELAITKYQKLEEKNVDMMGGIHGWGTTFGTKDFRTLSHWISVFIMISYYSISQFY